MASVTIVGLGTTGSAVAMLLSRMPQIERMILVDSDSYESSNLLTQTIDRKALGRPKTAAIAAQIRAVTELVQLNAVQERVENVPLGTLCSSIMVSCVDNPAARQVINRVACRLGLPWIDCAVDPDSLIRVNAYKAGWSAPCLECAWGEQSYALLPQEYPCDAGDLTVPATGTPAERGTLAAAIVAGVLRTLIDDDSVYFPLSYFSTAVIAASAQMVTSGVMVAGQPFDYRIYALARGPMQNRQASEIEIVAVDEVPAIERTAIAPLLAESEAHAGHQAALQLFRQRPAGLCSCHSGCLTRRQHWHKVQATLKRVAFSWAGFAATWTAPFSQESPLRFRLSTPARHSGA